MGGMVWYALIQINTTVRELPERSLLLQLCGITHTLARYPIFQRPFCGLSTGFYSFCDSDRRGALAIVHRSW
jgi:hypothetical protein